MHYTSMGHLLQPAASVELSVDGVIVRATKGRDEGGDWVGSSRRLPILCSFPASMQSTLLSSKGREDNSV